MKTKYCYLFILVGALWLAGCWKDPFVPVDTVPTEIKTGHAEISFPLPPTEIPQKGIHRIDLSLALSIDSLNRENFYRIVNVSDFQSQYSFVLNPGQYFYRAGITCSCGGDTCLWNNFPGGQYGIKWTIGWFTVEKGKTVNERITFY
jgi:hypothetical protein